MFAEGSATAVTRLRSTARVSMFEGDRSIEMEKVDVTEKQLVTLFRQFDASGDGFVDLGELQTALARVGQPVSPAEAQQILTQVDENGDGQISFEEFRQLTSILNLQADEQVSISEAQLTALFREFDTSGDGFIDLGELQAALAKIGQPVSPTEAQQILTQVDENGDGQVTRRVSLSRGASSALDGLAAHFPTPAL